LSRVSYLLLPDPLKILPQPVIEVAGDGGDRGSVAASQGDGPELPAAAAVADKGNPAAIGADSGEAVDGRGGGEAQDLVSGIIDPINVKVAVATIAHKDDVAAIGRPGGAIVGGDGGQGGAVAAVTIDGPDAAAVAGVVTAAEDNGILEGVPIGRFADTERRCCPILLCPGDVNPPDAIPLAVAGKGNAVALRVPSRQTIFGKTGKAQEQIGGRVPGADAGHVIAGIVKDQPLTILAHGGLYGIIAQERCGAAGDALLHNAAAATGWVSRGINN